MTLYRLYFLLILCAIGTVELLVHWPRPLPQPTSLEVKWRTATCTDPIDQLARDLCAAVNAGPGAGR